MSKKSLVHLDPVVPAPDGAGMLRVDVLSALLAWAGNDLTRPGMAGIQVEDDGGRMLAVATDGHRMLVLVVPTGATIVAGVRCRAELERLLRIAKATGDTHVALPPPNGAEFPLWRKVLPGRGAVRADGGVGVNPRFLADLVPACQAAGANSAVLTAAKGPLNPLRWEIHSRDGWGFVAGIMPMRVHGDDMSLPRDLMEGGDKAAQ